MHVQFAQLINTCRKLGPEKFPLIEQTFYPNYKEMVRTMLSPPFLLHKLKMFLFVIDIKNFVNVWRDNVRSNSNYNLLL